MFKTTQSVGILMLITLILFVIFIISHLTTKETIQTNEFGQMSIKKHPFGIGSQNALPSK